MITKRCIPFILIVFIIFLPGCKAKQEKMKATSLLTTIGVQPMLNTPQNKVILESRLAGTWYPYDKNALLKELSSYIDEADAAGYSDINALILPHAGYQYSGRVAAYGVKQIKGNHYTRVIILGPTHRYAMTDTINVPPYTHYKTPLGEIKLDTDFIEKLTRSYFVTKYSEVHLNEHSVQIELPLLQVALGDFLLVPIVVGQLSTFTVCEIADKLLSLIDEKTLVVVSSDFCHYGKNYGYVPFTENIEKNINNLDMEAFDLIRQKDFYGFTGYLERTGTTICGRNPISILLAMTGDTMDVHPGTYNTSGAMTGDFSNSVSYFSIIFTGKWDHAGNPAIKQDEELSISDKKALLSLARKTLKYYLKNKKYPDPDELGIGISSAMRQVMGGFVTLEKHSALRGCIGDIYPRRPLYLVVMDHAINAAVNDSRFMPVQEEEFKEIEIEISTLTPPHPVSSYEEIILGKHGIVLSKQGHSAVFLPQVAPEQGWNLETTLSRLSLKAGLSQDSWKKGARFLVFEAIVFSEKDAYK